MKLAILAQSYLFDKTSSINGTLVQLHNLSKGFAKAGVEVHYIATTKDSSKPEEEVTNGIYFHWIYSKDGMLEWYLNMAKYKAILETVQANAIYVRGRNVLQYVAGQYASKYKINFVWGTNGDDSAELWKNVKRLKKSKKSLVRKILLLPLKVWEDSFINRGMKFPDTIINQSKHQQKETKRLLNREGVILPSFFLKTECPKEKENSILWLATLSPNKQPEEFVKLIQSSQMKDWTAILGGGSSDKNFEDKIRSSIENCPIEFEGEIDFNNTFEYYCKSKIFVNTSIREGLPNAYIQSWLSGTVVLTLNHDPNGWLKTHNIGYCANGDREALKSKLQQLMNDPDTLNLMSNNAQKFANETFAGQYIINEYLKCFRGENNA